jgi:integrase
MCRTSYRPPRTADEVLDVFAKVDGDKIDIQCEDIDFAEGTAWVEDNMVRTKADGAKINDGKTRNARRGIPLADWFVTMLLDRRARIAAERGVQQPEYLIGWVFPNTKGGLRGSSNLRRDWRAFRDRHRIGDRFTPRTFRRTVATLVTDVLPAREASDLLGHSRVSQTTDSYVGRLWYSVLSAARLRAVKGHQDQI